MSEQSLPVAVIGAGPSGLATCKTLGEFGIPFECFEAESSVGGIWNTHRERGGGYHSLTTNTSTASMCFSDFPFPGDHPAYGTAEEMVRYFRAYAEHFALEQHIRFGTRVERVRPLEGGGWRLDLLPNADDESSKRGSAEYRAVIVASGQYNSPRRPHDEIEGHFSGQQLHVFDYLDPATPVDCRGKRVVVVGLGSSAAEVATELSDPKGAVGCAQTVVLSARSGRWVMPKLANGKPVDQKALHPAARLPIPLRWLPSEVSANMMRRIFGRILRLQWEKIGGAARLGLPEPTIEPWADRPTLSVDFIPALEDGRIEIRPGIRRFDGDRVCFEDGSETQAEIVLYATGYELAFPYLDRETLGCDAKDLALYQRIAHPSHEGLFFVGHCRVMCSLWPLAEQQSRWLARLLSGGFSMPNAQKRQRKAVPLTTTLPVMCNAYVEDLRKEAGGF